MWFVACAAAHFPTVAPSATRPDRSKRESPLRNSLCHTVLELQLATSLHQDSAPPAEQPSPPRNADQRHVRRPNEAGDVRRGRICGQAGTLAVSCEAARASPSRRSPRRRARDAVVVSTGYFIYLALRWQVVRSAGFQPALAAMAVQAECLPYGNAVTLRGGCIVVAPSVNRTRQSRPCCRGSGVQ